MWELRIWNFRIVKINRKVPQSSRKVAQSFKIYLCGTLRFTLRNSAVKKSSIQLRNSYFLLTHILKSAKKQFIVLLIKITISFQPVCSSE